MDRDEQVFNAVLNQVSARESANSTYLTIASSASLVFLGLIAFNEHNPLDKNNNFWMVIIGVLFPVLSLWYVEITRLCIHRKQQKWIREQTTYPDILKISTGRGFRTILGHVIILLPVMGWTIMTTTEIPNSISCFILGWEILIGSLVILYILNKPDNKKLESYD